MLTVEQARDIANVWRPKFSEEDAFNTSWSRYMDMVKDQSPGSLVAWLETDQQREAVRSAGIVREPVLPTRQSPEFTAAVEAALERVAAVRLDCWQCGKFQDELATEACGNPRWHLPNLRSPAPRPVPGWHSLASAQPLCDACKSLPDGRKTP